jgi:coproporphyrinogen III oxidase-like Fe-S oxidoreductase
MGHSTFHSPNNSRDQHVYSELLDKTNLDVLHSLYVHPICNQFCQFPFCNVYQVWRPDELNQLLLGLVKDLLHWLLKYQQARNVNDQFHNRFTLVPRNPTIQRFSNPFI